ncbi:MAG: DUF881 domain-containing protein [Nocardioides sp.]|uniref:DUF881 domain-containing protein n=1 Tax=Nocardioides sp. TaxID=35761 RepID=UPI0039E44186
MTRGSHARPEGWRIATPLVVVICGGLLAVSAINSDGTDLRPDDTSVDSLVQSERGDYMTLENEVTTTQDDIDHLTSSVPDSLVKRYQRQVATLKDPAGLTAETGPGVSITLSDAPEEVADKTDLNPNLMVVHQQDIQAVVNALWKGGATAVTIAGKRVISTTGIKCSGSTVQLQGVPYPQPYVIQAVGDPTKLTAALDADDYVTLYRSQSEDPRIDIGWSFRAESEVKAPAYDGLLDLHYAQPIKSN